MDNLIRACKNNNLIRACKNNNIQLVITLLKHPKIDPSYDGDLAIKIAIKYEYIGLVWLLLQDHRVDTSTANSNNFEIKKMLEIWKR